MTIIFRDKQATRRKKVMLKSSELYADFRMKMEELAFELLNNCGGSREFSIPRSAGDFKINRMEIFHSISQPEWADLDIRIITDTNEMVLSELSSGDLLGVLHALEIECR